VNVDFTRQDDSGGVFTPPEFPLGYVKTADTLSCTRCFTSCLGTG